MSEMDILQSFRDHVGQTSPFPNQLEVVRASGCRMFDPAGKAYLDFISGIAVLNVGHCHPGVVEAICEQVRLFSHTMVYGEHIQRPQIEMAAEIASVAPEGLDATCFLTTGAEANEAALKMAVKLTGRSGVVAFRKAYHGDTLGALSCFGEERFRAPFAPLLKPVQFLNFGDEAQLEWIGHNTAAVLVEPVQGEAGIHLPPKGWLASLRSRCTETGAMLIFDEVQTGFGRLGEWFAAHKYEVTPDAITMAKGMGMGMPLAGLLAPRDLLFRFAADPPFSHITTFGGHPVSCAAGLAGMRIIRQERLLENARAMGEVLVVGLRKLAESLPAAVESVRGVGLMIGAQLASEALARSVVIGCKENGLILETTLLDERVVRFSPPLVVSRTECEEALEIFGRVLNQAASSAED